MLLALAMCLSSFSVYAIDYPFWIDEIGPEKGSIQEISDEKLNADIEKVRQIAMKYADKYVVTQEDYVDTTVIDDCATLLNQQFDDLYNEEVENA